MVRRLVVRGSCLLIVVKHAGGVQGPARPARADGDASSAYRAPTDSPTETIRADAG